MRQRALHGVWIGAVGWAALLAGSARAEGLGTEFSYQGRLTLAGVPVTGDYDLQFSLWSAATGGTQIGTPDTLASHRVANGLFTAELDFGAVFDGDARWLQIAVQGPGGGGYATLTPRQPLTATPYALYALKAPWSGLGGVPAGFLDGVDNDTTYSAGDGLSLVGTEFRVNFAGTGNALAAARSDHGHFGDAWTGSSGASGLSLTNSSTAFGAKGLYARASGALGETYGVYGRCDSTDGTGVYGSATAPSGQTYGVYGFSASVQGYGVYGTSPTCGVYGDATAASGKTRGTYGACASTEGHGVHGLATATTGEACGVFGQSHSTSGRGVYGHAAADTGYCVGVYGQSDSTRGTGVYGTSDYVGVYGEVFADSAYAGFPIAVYGKSHSSGGWGVYGTAPAGGVYGVASAGSGDTRGVYGEVASTTGHAVHGSATATSGGNTGVYGHTNSIAGIGVHGRSPYIGVYGIGFDTTTTPAGIYHPIGVYGTAIGELPGIPIGVYGHASSLGWAGYFQGHAKVSGNFYVDGDKHFVHPHPNDPTKEIIYTSLEGGESGTYVRGTAELRNGEARVELPEHFALVTSAEGVTATLTPVGSYLQLYIADQAADHLLVREASGKDGQFNYLVQGVRKGHEDHQVIRDRMPRPEPLPPPGTRP